jgi:hypothetical protein
MPAVLVSATSPVVEHRRKVGDAIEPHLLQGTEIDLEPGKSCDDRVEVPVRRDVPRGYSKAFAAHSSLQVGSNVGSNVGPIGLLAVPQSLLPGGIRGGDQIVFAVDAPARPSAGVAAREEDGP